jgi:tetratricopeptide (TPR) repeat protein
MIEPKLEQAFNLHQSDQLDEAEQAYLDILMDDPKNAEVIKLLGVLSCQKGQFDDGISYLQAAVEIDDTVSEYHLVLGHSYLSVGKVEEAIASLTKAGEIDPGREDVFAALGDAFQNVQNFPEALRAYHRAAEIEPTNIQYRVNAGLSALFSGQTDLATKYLEQTASENDAIPQIPYGLAILMADAGDRVAAHELMSKAVALDPENPEYLRLQKEYA